MGEFPPSMRLLEASLAGEVAGEGKKREDVGGGDGKMRFPFLFATRILSRVMAPTTANQPPQKPVCLQGH